MKSLLWRDLIWHLWWKLQVWGRRMIFNVTEGGRACSDFHQNETYLTLCSPPWWGRGRGPEQPGPVGRPESPEPPGPPSAGAQRGGPGPQPPTPRSSSSPVAPQRFSWIIPGWLLSVTTSRGQCLPLRNSLRSSADLDAAEDNKRNKPACTEKSGW